MSIKWEGIKILRSPLTNIIYLGKLDKTGEFATDKSDDRTQELLSAVMGYLDNQLEENQTEVSYDCKAGVLTWKRNIKIDNKKEI